MSDSWNNKVVGKKFCLEYIGENKYLFSKRNILYQSNSVTGKKTKIGVIPCPLLKKLISYSRLGQRMLRFMVYNAIPLANGEIFVTFGKNIGIFSNGKYKSLDGIIRQCRVLRGSCALGSDGALYWGEYISNKERHPIHIYRYIPGNNKAEIVYSFKEKEVRHVHGIYKDPYSQTLWCVTGDHPHECKMMYTTDHFRSLQVFGEGDETWRAVSLLFTQDAIFYASDAEFRPNYIYKVDRKTKKRHEIQKVDGPVYYSYKAHDNLFFAVTAELCPSQKEKNATLWCVSPLKNTAQKILSYPKDILAIPFFVKLFMPGAFHFPIKHKESLQAIYASSIGLTKVDNKILQITSNSTAEKSN